MFKRRAVACNLKTDLLQGMQGSVDITTSIIQIIITSLRLNPLQYAVKLQEGLICRCAFVGIREPYIKNK